MPQGQIRKGFFFYFGLFVLLLIAIFLICLVVMMFNPGKTVLWMQYFTGNEHILVTKTKDTQTEINWANVSNLEISCSYANVSVQRSKQYPEDGIHIINNAKGISAAANAVSFSYNVYFEGSTLKIDVTEPNGFIYFSKDIQIILNAYSENSLNFNHMKLTIKGPDEKGTDGNIELGGVAYGSKDVNLSALTINAGKGNIYLNDKFDTSTLTALTLSSEEGKIQSNKEVVYGNVTGKGITVNCDTTLKTSKGLITFEVLNLSGKNLDVVCKKGNVNIKNLYAGTTSVSCVQGNYNFGKVYGNLTYTNSEDSIIAPNIMAEYIQNNFTLTTTGNVNADPDIDIKEIGGNVVVLADKGRLVVGKAHGAISVTSANDLYVDIVVAEDKATSSIVDIRNENGEVNLGFLGDINGTILVTTNTGKIGIDFTNVAKFTADAFVGGSTVTRVADDKIFVSIGLSGGQSKNPLSVNGTSSVTGRLTITTNSNISYNLVARDTLVA